MKHNKEPSSKVPTHRKIIAGAALAGMTFLGACASDGGGADAESQNRTPNSTSSGVTPTTAEVAPATNISPDARKRAERDKALEAQYAKIEVVALQISESVFARIDELHAANSNLEGTGIKYTYSEHVPGTQEGLATLDFIDPENDDLLCGINMRFTTGADGVREASWMQISCTDFQDIIPDNGWEGSDSMSSVGVILSTDSSLGWTIFGTESTDVGMDGDEYHKVVSSSSLEPLSDSELDPELEKAKFIAAYIVQTHN